MNDRPVRPDGSYVLHWMIAFRRASSNFALQRAAEAARELGRPLVVLEPLKVDYEHASARLHRFVIDGMIETASAFRGTPVTYLPVIEREAGQTRRCLEELVAAACLVTTDDYPAFFLPAAVAALAARAPVRVEAVDSNGLLPIHAATREFQTALAFRRFVQGSLREQLRGWPSDLRFDDLPRPATLPHAHRRWPIATADDLANPDALIRSLPIDQAVRVVEMRGGSAAAQERLDWFVQHALSRYHDDARQPQTAGTSRLSPYLHFGHISAHQVFDAVMRAENWTPRKLGAKALGARAGWWGVSPGAEAFLDQAIVWRELGFNACTTRPDDYWQLTSLPPWAHATLARHARDRRNPLYTRAAFEQAATHDPIWNAAQRQLLRDGWMHNYLRMLWGKKILEWSASPEEALATMAAIMNRHAIDGRDPNSYSGYLWTLGRYDRPWGPERPVFGTVRCMSSANTAKKLKLTAFLEEFGPDARLF
jgi:deoxyribodipyrimidine photo-lyase